MCGRFQAAWVASLIWQQSNPLMLFACKRHESITIVGVLSQWLPKSWVGKLFQVFKIWILLVLFQAALWLFQVAGAVGADPGDRPMAFPGYGYQIASSGPAAFASS